MVDPRMQFCQQVIIICNVISRASGVLIDDHIYLVIPGPGPFPDAFPTSLLLLPYYLIPTFTTKCANT
jgi:hypothetical protein